MPKILNLESDTPGSMSGSTSMSGTSGVQSVVSYGAPTLIASIEVEGVGKVGMNFFLFSGALTDLIVCTAEPIEQRWTPATLPAAPGTGDSVIRLVASAGDFAILDDFMSAASPQPQNMAVGGSAYADFDLGGDHCRMDIWAKSTTPGTTMLIDVTGSSADIG